MWDLSRVSAVRYIKHSIFPEPSIVDCGHFCTWLTQDPCYPTSTDKPLNRHLLGFAQLIFNWLEEAWWTNNPTILNRFRCLGSCSVSSTSAASCIIPLEISTEQVSYASVE